MHSNKRRIKKIVESPCIEATLALYDKNIRTTSTDANKNTIGYSGHISIYIYSLSEENMTQEQISSLCALYDKQILALKESNTKRKQKLLEYRKNMQSNY